MCDDDWQEFFTLIHDADALTVGRDRENPIREIGLMFRNLSIYTLDQIKDAVSALLRKCKYKMTIADIVGYIDSTEQEQSLAAWDLFIRVVEVVGSDDSVRFPNPAFHYVIERMGGWERVANYFDRLSDDVREFRKKDWRSAYETGLRKASWSPERGKVAVAPYLIGFFERDNREKGFPEGIPDILLIHTGKYVKREEIGAGILPLVKPLIPLGYGNYGFEPRSISNLMLEVCNANER